MRLLADENFDNNIVRAMLRQRPSLDSVRRCLREVAAFPPLQRMHPG